MWPSSLIIYIYFNNQSEEQKELVSPFNEAYQKMTAKKSWTRAVLLIAENKWKHFNLHIWSSSFYPFSVRQWQSVCRRGCLGLHANLLDSDSILLCNDDHTSVSELYVILFLSCNRSPKLTRVSFCAFNRHFKVQVVILLF